MKRGWQVASLCLLMLCGTAIVFALRLPLKDALGPGPGFFPLCLAVLGSVLAVLLFIEVSAGAQASEQQVASASSGGIGASLRVLAVILALAGAALALDPIGFRLTALGFTTALLLALGATSPLIIVPFVLSASFGVFHVFYYWLKVPLPIGMFGI